LKITTATLFSLCIEPSRSTSMHVYRLLCQSSLFINV